MPRWLRTLLHLTPILLSACAVSVAGLVVFRAVAPLDTLRASSSELGNYLQTLGGIYAVLLAFVVFVVWAQFNEVRTYIDREASAIVDLHRTASSLPQRTRTAIQAGLRHYVDAVLRDEWHAMTAGDEAAIERVGHELDAVWLAVHACQPTSTGQHTVYGEVIVQYNQLTDLRTNRLSAARTRVPLVMKILLYTGAVLVTGSIYLMTVPALWLHATITAALAGAITHILYLIHDLDEAFAGEGHVSQDAFIRARASCDRMSMLVAEHPGELDDAA